MGGWVVIGQQVCEYDGVDQCECEVVGKKMGMGYWEFDLEIVWVVKVCVVCVDGVIVVVGDLLYKFIV